ncbi:ATP synthase subunit G atp20 [Zalaria obscura]|uniref:ATP synthase subunit G atp20 n=1 Tax=Zalaria obscura TaxID=2024903 RepID=A0ACC3S446_9PEZI
MSLSASRVLVRRPQFALRRVNIRNQSTTSKATDAASNTASKAKESASNATSKASEGLSRVQSSATSGVSKAASAAGNALNSIGGRTGRLISFAQSLVPPTVYYSRVALELGKLIANGRKMSPPSIQTFQNYAQPLLNAFKNPSTLMNSPTQMLSQMRSWNRQQYAAAGVVAAETIGFFTVGQMIGRFKVVGYHGESAHH